MIPARVLLELDDGWVAFLRPDPRAAVLPEFRIDGDAVARLTRGLQDPRGAAQLRAAAGAFAGGDSGGTAQLAGRVGAAVARGTVQAYRVRTEPVAAGTAGDDRAVPLIDDAGRSVLAAAGRPMQRPAGLDPHVLVDAGLADRRAEEAMLQSGGGTGVLGYIAGRLARFKQGGPWDAQRIGGRFHPEFVDYATVAIGLYAAASGMKQDEILGIQNGYAALFSRYPAGTLMDPTYSHLPARNVANTALGYGLFATGRIRATGR